MKMSRGGGPASGFAEAKSSEIQKPTQIFWCSVPNECGIFAQNFWLSGIKLLEGPTRQRTLNNHCSNQRTAHPERKVGADRAVASIS